MTAIPGATSQTYVPVSADAGLNITCTVTATNAAGNADATSSAVGPIVAGALIAIDAIGASVNAPSGGALLTAGAGQANEANDPRAEGRLT